MIGDLLNPFFLKGSKHDLNHFYWNENIVTLFSIKTALCIIWVQIASVEDSRSVPHQQEKLKKKKKKRAQFWSHKENSQSPLWNTPEI